MNRPLLTVLLFLCLALPCAAQEAPAQQTAAIDGAFGWTLGVPMEEPATESTYKSPDYPFWEYTVATPPTPSRFFDKYVLALEPESLRLVSINATKSFESEEAARQAFAELAEVLAAKYGPGDVADDITYFLVRDGRSISANYLGQSSIGALYTDDALEKEVKMRWQEQRDTQDKDAL